MPSVKTAVSLPKEIYDQTEAAAQEMKVSRSSLYALALKEWLRRRESQRMLDQLNEVYKDPPDEEERQYLKAMERLQAEVLERDEW
jgi:metal-responsive CopG/Arc/MetJ family transcriptional regulator